MSEEGKASQQLASWKEIADYLHVAVRTAQTWEREKGLPVRRMPGEKGRVAADPAELDQWRRSASCHGRSWFNLVYLKIYAALSTVFLIIAVACLSTHFLDESHHQPHTGFRNGALPLVVADHQGNTPLKKGFPQGKQTDTHPGATLSLHRKIMFFDFDGDGELETLLDYSPVDLPQNFTSSYCFPEGENTQSSVPTGLAEAGDRLPGTRPHQHVEARRSAH